MENKFSAKSKERLVTAHADLQFLFNRVLSGFDCSILEGYRSKARQEKLFLEGNSKIREGGKHCIVPSLAVDVAPCNSNGGWPVDWDDLERFRQFGFYVLGVADAYGIQLRWGGDWNGNKIITDQTFNDLVHFEINQ